MTGISDTHCLELIRLCISYSELYSKSKPNRNEVNKKGKDATLLSTKQPLPVTTACKEQSTHEPTSIYLPFYNN